MPVVKHLYVLAYGNAVYVLCYLRDPTQKESLRAQGILHGGVADEMQLTIPTVPLCGL